MEEPGQQAQGYHTGLKGCATLGGILFLTVVRG